MPRTAAATRNLYDLDRFNLRIANRVGDQVRASNAAKLLAYREGQQSTAGLHVPAGADGTVN